MQKNKFFIIFSLIFIFSLFFSGCNFIKPNIMDDTDMTPRVIALSGELSTEEVVGNVKSAIVGIKSNISGGYAVGSGVAIRQGGYILTNQHVINGAKSITIYFANKTTGSATLIWQDASIDLAVIKSSQDMPYLECETEGVAVGQDVLAIGTPLSLAFQHTVTKGIVSALNRTLEFQSINGVSTYMQNLIQHDASINPGNSGGPLINSRGRVIGINTLKANDAEGIGFAIPIITGYSIVERLSVDNGYTVPYMGVMGITCDHARSKDIEIENDGLYILDVDKTSNAGISGLEVGDVIYKIDNTPIKNFLDLRTFLYKHSVGDKITIYLYRQGSPLQINVVLGERNI